MSKINQELKLLIEEEQSTIPNFIDPKSETDYVVYKMVSDLIFPLIMISSNSIFLKESYIKSISLDIIDLMREIKEYDEKIYKVYNNKIKSFIKKLKITSIELEEYESAKNLTTLLKFIRINE